MGDELANGAAIWLDLKKIRGVFDRKGRYHVTSASSEVAQALKGAFPLTEV